MQKIDLESREYPTLLKQIKDPPPFIYFRGDWNPELFRETLSVVGSRRMTRYGETMAESLVRDIAGEGITVVSGFMYGIDATAHAAAVTVGGKTIAVMPCGIERIHPAYQEELYYKIIKTGGLIVSEYTGDSPPALWTYPRRNRIIAGLSPLLLVIEAGLKSGALITARLAEKQGKKIYAVPGPLTSAVSRGTAYLLNRGSTVVTGSKEILKEYGRSVAGAAAGKRGNVKTFLNRLQKDILRQLSREPMSADELTRALETSPQAVGAELTVLAIQKFLALQEGRYFLIDQDVPGCVYAD